MNSEEWYKASQNRYTCSYFKQDIVPDKKIIEKIIEESLKTTPVFSNICHHEIEIYGPEYFEDKKRMAIQGVENVHLRKMFDDRRKTTVTGIDFLRDYLEDFIEYVEDGKAKNFGFRGEKNYKNNPDVFVPFNTQLMAPYLLVFKTKPHHFGKKSVTENYEETEEGVRLKSFQSAMTQAYAISIIATHYNVDVGFCGCFIVNDENVNKIWYNDYDIIKFVGLGYSHESCYEGPKSLMGKNKWKKRPSKLSDICTWKNKNEI